MTKRSIFLGLREGVRRFFAFEADRLVPAAAAGGAPDVAPPALVSAGRFGLIGLEGLQEVMGPRWSALEARVRELAEAVIQGHLTQGDVFEQQGDGSYVVLFARLGQAETDFKCRVIGREITERLLGSELPRLADVESVSAQVTRRALEEGDVEAVLSEAFAAAAPVVTSDPAAPPRSEDGPAPRAAASPHVGPAFTAPDAADDPDWRTIEAEARAGMARVVAAAHERAGRPAFAWGYAPVWDFKSMSLVRFRLSASRGRRSAGPAEAARFEQDLAALSRALDDLSALTAQARRLVVVCTAQAGGLSVEWRRRQVLQLLADASRPVRRLLRLELITADFAVPPTLGRFVEAVDGLGVECAVCAPLVAGDVVPSGTRFRTAAVELDAALPQAEALVTLKTFAAQCARAGLQSAAHGLGTRSLVIGAVAAGVQFLSGDAVHPEVDDPRKGLRFEPADLYRDLLVRAAESGGGA